MRIFTKEDTWLLIQTPNRYIGWINATDIVVKDTTEMKGYKKAKKIVYSKQGGFSAKAIDCSGFTSLVYLMHGIVLQRDASQQIKYGQQITLKYKYKGLQSGDLLFFGRKRKNTDKMNNVTHVGMYIGDSEFIHASGRVKISSMDSISIILPNVLPDLWVLLE